MKSRAVPLFLSVLLLAGGALAARPAEAQIGIPRPGGQRPRPSVPQGARPPVVPRGETGTQGQARPPATPGDTTPGDSSRTPRLEAVNDSMIDRLLRLEGYVPTEYAADSAEFRNADRTLRLRGNPEVRREGSTITARDSIVYRERSDFIAAYGQPQGDPSEGEPISGDVFFYDLAARRATVQGARTKITDGATWYVQGTVTDERGERIYATNSTFTSDDRPDPAYHFRADKIMIVRNRILVGRPAYLYFRNVPVFWLPFIVQDLERGRRSGLLIPEFEINDIVRTNTARGARGTGREISNIGYYWAINEYMGLQLAGRWRSEAYTGLAGQLDLNWRRRFLNGSISFERFWPKDQASRLNLNGSARWQYNERTDLSLTLGFASSSEFERDRTVDPLRQQQDLNSSFSLTRQLDWGNLSVNAERRQSLANDDVTFTPRFTLGVNPITILPDVVLNVGVNGSRTTTSPGEGFERRLRDEIRGDVGGNASISLGDFTVSGNAAYSLNELGTLEAIDSLRLDPSVTFRPEALKARPGSRSERMSTSLSTGYQLRLIGTTAVSPSIGFSQEFVRRDTAAKSLPGKYQEAYGGWVSGPPRLNLGATLRTDLYGFFPGFGNYEAIRHNIRPIFTYTYSPAVGGGDPKEDLARRLAFGSQVGRTVNRLQLTLDQTFEAKVRQSRPVGGDSLADSARSAGNRAQPEQSQKVTLLAITTTTPITYSFVDVDSLGTRFEQDQIANTIRSDLLGGLNFSITHDLFDDRLEGGRTRRGSFRPFLTSFNTSFSFGQNAALFRWLGFARTTEQEARIERGQTPDQEGRPPLAPTGGATATGNNQQVGQGPWNVSLSYSLLRARRSASDTLPGSYDPGNADLRGNITFYPTRNWAVTWNTGYSLTDRTFSEHVIRLKRDLYRWQANFDYIVAPNGNTSFSFSVHLIDLPDLKADYNERDLGVDRQRTTTNP